MSDLISRSALLEQVKAIHKAVNTSEVNVDYDTGFHSATSQIQGLIQFMPTAFDLDKVVEELEELKDASSDVWNAIDALPAFGEMCAYGSAIEIVRRGGDE